MLGKSQHESKDYQNLEVCTEKLEKCFERNSASNLIDNKVSYPSYSEIQEPFIRRDFPIRKDLPTLGLCKNSWPRFLYGTGY
jgi:hypothetical protein